MNRFRIRLCLSAAVLVAVGVAVPLSTASGATAPATGAILFQDDFSGAAGATPDASRWTDYSACAYNPSAAFGSITCGASEKLDGSGHLVVPATPRSGSAIRTGDRFGFVYGTASAWIKLPRQAGYWPAFWTLNSRADGSTEFPIGEADIMEGYTTWLNAYHATGHSYAANGSRYDAGDALCPQAANVDLSAAYHKYSARIEPGMITYFFDDVQCRSVYTKAAGRPWGFGPDVTRPNWLILDLAVGGAGGQQKTPTADAQMLVDRVEVRALPSASPTSTATSTPTSTATSTPTSTATSTATSSPAPQAAGAAGAAVVNNAVYRLANDCGGQVLQIPASGAKSGTPLQTGAWTGRDGQRWQVVSVGSGYDKLINVGSGMAANVAYSSTSDGAPIIQYPDRSGANAQWKITVAANGTAQLIARNSGKALDVKGGSAAAGAAVDQATPAAGCAQTWRLVRS